MPDCGLGDGGRSDCEEQAAQKLHATMHYNSSSYDELKLVLGLAYT
jgi:hypothetical protein